jgi:hypothetical protein
MAPKVNSVVKDTHDFDRVARSRSKHQEMASAPAVPCHVKRTKACHDLVSRPGARNLGTLSQLAHRLNKGIAIDSRLSRAKVLCGPPEDVGEVDLCGCTETNAPSPPGHDSSIRRFER